MVYVKDVQRGSYTSRTSDQRYTAGSISSSQSSRSSRGTYHTVSPPKMSVKLPVLARQDSFRCLNSPMFDEAFGSSTQSLLEDVQVQPMRPPTPSAPTQQPKSSLWRRLKSAKEPAPTARPESFFCASSAAIEEAFASSLDAASRDRYQAACITSASYIVPMPVCGLDALDKSPMAEPFRGRPYPTEKHHVPQTFDSRESRKHRRHGQTMQPLPPVPPLPEQYRRVIASAS